MDNESGKSVFIPIPIGTLPEKNTPDGADKFVMDTPEGPRYSKWENVLKQVTGGWNIVTDEVQDGERVVKRIVNFVGGVPPLPQALQDLIGLYYSGSGGFTADISLATDYKGTAGNDGADGKTTEQWTAKPFVAGSTVYFGGNSIWQAAEDTLDTDVPGVSPKWELRITANETIESTEVAAVVDALGSMVAEWDKDGKFKTPYQDRSIPNEALEREIKDFFEGSQLIEDDVFVRVWTDSVGNIIKGLKKDGTMYFNRIEADEYAGNIKQNNTEEHPITDAKFLTFDFPDSVVDVDVYGILPTDTSDARATTNVILTFSKGGQFLFKCKGEMAIQGQGSIGYLKKGYEVDFLNSKGETLMIKWGHMHAVDAINFKGFHSDPTMTRDVSASRLWHKIRTSRPFPSSFIADFSGNYNTSNAKYLYMDDALFYAEGFPMRMTSNGNPFGLYVWRMKKKRENYRMDNGNLNNIFLDSANSYNVLDFLDFKHEHWDLKSPKVSGYVEAGPINNPTVLASINRVFDWAGEYVYKSDAEFKAEAHNYFNMHSVFDYILSCEAVYAVDSSGNNTEFMTWDGLHWSFCIYDQDNSAGFFNGFMGVDGLALRGDFWYKFKGAFEAEIAARYAELRDSGVLSLSSIYETYAAIPRTIPTEYYTENLAIWGWVGQNEGNESLRRIMNWFQGRIAFLDSLYNYN